MNQNSRTGNIYGLPIADSPRANPDPICQKILLGRYVELRNNPIDSDKKPMVYESLDSHPITQVNGATTVVIKTNTAALLDRSSVQRTTNANPEKKTIV
jgi:hypothetical protein